MEKNALCGEEWLHPSSPAQGLEMLHSTRVSSVELPLPSFQLGHHHEEGSGPPRGVFQSFSHCFDSRDAAAGMTAPGGQFFIDMKDAVTGVRALAPCGRGGCPWAQIDPQQGESLINPTTCARASVRRISVSDVAQGGGALSM